MPLDNAINIDSNNEDYWMNLGLSQCKIGLYREASNSFSGIIRKSPNNRKAGSGESS